MPRKIVHEMEDSKEKRELCFHCIHSECINCLGGVHEQAVGSIKTAKDFSTVERMWWDGFTDKEIAAAVNRAESGVRSIRRRLGLTPPNPHGLRARA